MPYKLTDDNNDQVFTNILKYIIIDKYEIDKYDKYKQESQEKYTQ